MKKLKMKFISNNNLMLKEELSNHISRKYYRHLKSINATFLVNNEIKKLHEEVKIGDIIEIVASEEKNESNWPIINMELDIVYENEHYLVVNKPGGLLTIPTKSEPVSLYQLLSQYLNQKEIHILNRLDKETSGLMVIAKDRYSAYLLQPTHEHMTRKYLCMVKGVIDFDGHIENYIEKSIDSNKRYVTDLQEGKLAISDYRVLKKYDDKTLLEFILTTGRTHQIRVHTSHMNHPIIGDKLYGDGDGDLMLMSYYVCFTDPYTLEKVELKTLPRWCNDETSR